MRDRLLSLPKLGFVVSTRVALGAGLALLASRGMSKRATLATGATLVVIGAVTTIPAARLVFANPTFLQRARTVLG